MDFEAALQIVIQSIGRTAGPQAAEQAGADSHTALSEVGFSTPEHIKLLVTRVTSAASARSTALDPLWAVSITPYTSVRDVAHHVMYGTDSTGPKVRRDDEMMA